ncbi:MAG: phenylalanine--tRNA ligase subunit beta [Thiotrichales bacterium]
MKFSESWLRSHINPALDAAEIGHLLTMSGLELDGLSPVAPAFSEVVVARINAVAPHPDAEKLQVCTVDDGQGESRQVVCGAPNARAGLVTALARVGAELPNGLKIKRAKLRGVESAGMLCSAAELGVEGGAAGILELPAELTPGVSLRTALALDEQIFEIDLTPNRSDCLSVWGIARELGALTGHTPQAPEVEPVAPSLDDTFPVAVLASEACPRYVGRVIRGIRPDAVTPDWIRRRIERGGVRSISAVVDITNYIMLELGQPMHAFDLARLDREIRVRRGKPGERLTLLDGREIALGAQDLVIADASRVLALAGVMGGEGCGVSDATVDIFLESAFFAPAALAGRARAHGLHTESSHRFERGVDFALQRQAVERATRLILAVCGGAVGPVVEHVVDEALPQLPAIALHRERIPKRLGIALADGEVERILTALGCRLSAAATGWWVSPPSYRFDLRIEMDLIEELARVYGYDRIPANTRLWAAAIQPKPETQLPLRELKQRLGDRGYQEVISYSFVDPKVQAVLDPDAEGLALANPISSELAMMRTSLWPGLVQVVAHNLRRQQSRIRVYEHGLVFRQGEGELTQAPRIGGALVGAVQPQQWGIATREVDFHDAKGDVEALLTAAGIVGRVAWQVAEHPALHPGQTARLLLDGNDLGWVGALHPAVQRMLELDTRVFMFELDARALSERPLPRYRPLSRFPSVRRDIAIVVDESLPYQRIELAMRELSHPLISEFTVFDVYSGKGVANGRKSYALGLILQDISRTLEDEDVERAVAAVLAKLKTDLGASLRNS